MNFLLKNTANAEKSTDFNNTAYGLSNFIFPYSLLTIQKIVSQMKKNPNKNTSL